MTVTLKCSKVALLPPAPSAWSDSLGAGLLGAGLLGAGVGVAVTVTVETSLGEIDAVTVAVSAGWAVPFGVLEQAARPSMSITTGTARVTLVLTMRPQVVGWQVGGHAGYRRSSLEHRH